MDVEIRLPTIVGRASPKAYPDFTADVQDARSKLSKPILCIGAGGLGCELLKDLALVGFTHIHVIDLDTVDVTNLNRQFLFRPSDVNKSKAEAAANFVMKRIPSVTITWHHQDIKDMSLEFYQQFSVVVCGLDSIDARRWMNSTLLGLVKFDEDSLPDVSTIIPMIDGGTEGFKGGARVFIPHISACFECAIEMFPPQTVYQECTIAKTPRQPQHCIAYVKQLLWEREKPFGVDHTGKKALSIDTDNVEHMTWIFEQAKIYADQHNIKGVSYKLTQGVVKNIIPAIASTNAITAAAVANEAFKFVTQSSLALNNWIMFNSGRGEYTHTFEYEKSETCPACGNAPIVIKGFDATITLSELVTEYFVSHPKLGFKRIKSIRTDQGVAVYWPKFAAERTAENLNKQVRELFPSGTALSIVDEATMSANSAGITVIFEFLE